MSIVMSINGKTFFQPFMPFLANTNKNFEENLNLELFNQKVLRKPSLSLHCVNLRILATKIVWNMRKYSISAVLQNRIEIIGIEK